MDRLITIYPPSRERQASRVRPYPLPYHTNGEPAPALGGRSPDPRKPADFCGICGLATIAPVRRAAGGARPDSARAGVLCDAPRIGRAARCGDHLSAVSDGDPRAGQCHRTAPRRMVSTARPIAALRGPDRWQTRRDRSGMDRAFAAPRQPRRVRVPPRAIAALGPTTPWRPRGHAAATRRSRRHPPAFLGDKR